MWASLFTQALALRGRPKYVSDQDARHDTHAPQYERLEHLDPLPISKAVVEGEEVLGAQDDLVREMSVLPSLAKSIVALVRRLVLTSKISAHC